MVYRGFTWNCSAGEAAQIRMLLQRLLDDKPMLKVDRHLAQYYVLDLDRFLEVTPDVPTSTRGTADA